MRPLASPFSKILLLGSLGGVVLQIGGSCTASAQPFDPEQALRTPVAELPHLGGRVVKMELEEDPSSSAFRNQLFSIGVIGNLDDFPGVEGPILPSKENPSYSITSSSPDAMVYAPQPNSFRVKFRINGKQRETEPGKKVKIAFMPSALFSEIKVARPLPFDDTHQDPAKTYWAKAFLFRGDLSASNEWTIKTNGRKEDALKVSVGTGLIAKLLGLRAVRDSDPVDPNKHVIKPNEGEIAGSLEFGLTYRCFFFKGSSEHTWNVPDARKVSRELESIAEIGIQLKNGWKASVFIYDDRSWDPDSKMEEERLNGIRFFIPKGW